MAAHPAAFSRPGCTIPLGRGFSREAELRTRTWRAPCGEQHPEQGREAALQPDRNPFPVQLQRCSRHARVCACSLQLVMGGNVTLFMQAKDELWGWPHCPQPALHSPSICTWQSTPTPNLKSFTAVS